MKSGGRSLAQSGFFDAHTVMLIWIGINPYFTDFTAGCLFLLTGFTRSPEKRREPAWTDAIITSDVIIRKAEIFS